VLPGINGAACGWLFELQRRWPLVLAARALPGIRGQPELKRPDPNEKRPAGVTPPTLSCGCRPGCPVPPHSICKMLAIGGQQRLRAPSETAKARACFEDWLMRSFDRLLRRLLPVVPTCRKWSTSDFRKLTWLRPQIRSIIRAVPCSLTRGHERWARDAMDVRVSQDERCQCGRQSRVVLASRRRWGTCWREAVATWSAPLRDHDARGSTPLPPLLPLASASPGQAGR
jgi:hypothetical protein